MSQFKSKRGGRARKKSTAGKRVAPAIEPIVLRPHEAMLALGIGHSTLFKWLADGRLRSFRIGGVRFVAMDDIRAMLEANASRPARTELGEVGHEPAKPRGPRIIWEAGPEP